MSILRLRMLTDLRTRGYPAFLHTVYIDHVADFARFFMKSPELLGPEEIIEYQKHLVYKLKVAREILGDVLAALQFLYTTTLGKPWRIEPISGADLSLRQRMLEDMRILNISESCQYNYLFHVSKFANHFKKSPRFLGPEHVRKYMVHLTEVERASVPVRRMAASSLRFFYKNTLRRPWMLESIQYAKRLKKLPQILSTDEVSHFLDSIHNLKHRAMITAAYAGGLRLREIVSLKTTDIDSQRMVMRIYQGKGRKDRYVMLSQEFLETLRAYYKAARPGRGWLFPGRKPGTPMTSHALQSAFSKARERSGITKTFSIHTLRHCFATHLHEEGTDIRTIQLLLGHRCLSTTQIYLQLSQKNICAAESPLDLLKKKSAPTRKGSRTTAKKKNSSRRR